MPKYVKFLKELLTNKRTLDDSLTMELNAVCSAILQNKLPNKLKDPESFTIPCLIGSLNIKNALADLGDSINVMHYKMFKQLGLRKPKPIRMSIQLVDRSIRYPRGITGNVLVKVDKFISPVNFVVLDMDDDIEVPMILATARTIIDVGTGELVLRIGDENITFQSRDFVRVPSERDDTNYSVNEIPHENVLEPYLFKVTEIERQVKSEWCNLTS
ncbi:Transposon Ty3-I Gag-Pol polyprotein [Gossypium australe]|uniref:Transposon Ty3-I Gag-Pol polyprotein n=1 Tax=Gossypium australe TaxID=47621 RepID=A0A5B6VYM0_9ROSI|nr:Transposon Ty3-I Gag-Pol polyprotein [Gossypium australe]